MAAVHPPRLPLHADDDQVMAVNGNGGTRAEARLGKTSLKQGHFQHELSTPKSIHVPPPELSPSSPDHEHFDNPTTCEAEEEEEGAEDTSMSCLEMIEALAAATDFEKIKKQPIPHGKDNQKTSREANASDQIGGKDEFQRLSIEKMYELTSSLESLPISTSNGKVLNGRISDGRARASTVAVTREADESEGDEEVEERGRARTIVDSPSIFIDGAAITPGPSSGNDIGHATRPYSASRTVSTPSLRRRVSASKATTSSKVQRPQNGKNFKATPTPIRFQDTKAANTISSGDNPEPSPMPPSMPLPPRSLPTYLQLELSSQRPSPLYIHRSKTSDFPYESSRVKIERLLNFLLLPPQLEQVLWFGALACLDAWLFSFTILPLRFLKALSILAHSWGRNVAKEARYIGGFIYAGTGRMWRRRRRQEGTNGSASSYTSQETTSTKAKQKTPTIKTASIDDPATTTSHSESTRKYRIPSASKHKRSKSTPSALSPDHKADILKGLLILLSCTILMYFDASRMYHGIRGQAAIKLYVIYNVLEVGSSCDSHPYYPMLTLVSRYAIACSQLWAKTSSSVYSQRKH